MKPSAGDGGQPAQRFGHLTTVDDTLGISLLAQHYFAYTIDVVAGDRLPGGGAATTAGLFLTCAVAATFRRGWAGFFTFRN